MKGHIMSDEDFDPQDKLSMLLMEYIDSAEELSNNIKRVIQKKNNVLDSKAILAFNNYMIASNAISFLTDKLNASKMKLN